MNETAWCPSRPQWVSAEGVISSSAREMAVNKAAKEGIVGYITILVIGTNGSYNRNIIKTLFVHTKVESGNESFGNSESLNVFVGLYFY